MPPLVAYGNISHPSMWGVPSPSAQIPLQTYRWPSLVLLLGVCASEVTDIVTDLDPHALWFTMADGVPDKLCVFPADES